MTSPGPLVHLPGRILGIFSGADPPDRQRGWEICKWACSRPSHRPPSKQPIRIHFPDWFQPQQWPTKWISKESQRNLKESQASSIEIILVIEYHFKERNTETKSNQQKKKNDADNSKRPASPTKISLQKYPSPVFQESSRESFSNLLEASRTFWKLLEASRIYPGPGPLRVHYWELARICPIIPVSIRRKIIHIDCSCTWDDSSQDSSQDSFQNLLL